MMQKRLSKKNSKRSGKKRKHLKRAKKIFKWQATLQNENVKRSTS